MNPTKRLMPTLIVFGLLCWTGALPVGAVTIISQSANTDIVLGLPYWDLEFENPLLGPEKVQGYDIVEWRDADYAAGPPRWYDDWTVSHPGEIDGAATEIWMRRAGHSISTVTTLMGSTVSIHLQGDNNDGIAQVLVDGNEVARLDMYTQAGSQTALVIVKNLPFYTHTITINDLGMGSSFGTDVATLGAAVLRRRLKWSQPPVPGQPDNVFYGWNEESVYNAWQIVADDWVCDTPDPVTDLHWWGSFINWRESELPIEMLPIGFKITIWTDVPAGVDYPWSHPGQVIHEIDCTYYNHEFVGWDFDPRTGLYEACFRFDYWLEPHEYFHQQPGDNIYWVSIAAVYDATGIAAHPWGWKTRPRDLSSPAPDDAVRILDPVAPVLGVPFVMGDPIWWPTEDQSWDMAFELSASKFVPEPKWAQAPHPPDEGFDAPSDFWWNEDTTVENKWEQLPNPQQPGLDAFDWANDEGTYYRTILADDWLCEGGVVTDFHWWGAVEDPGAGLEAFELSIHDNDPQPCLPLEPALRLMHVPITNVTITPTGVFNSVGLEIMRYDYIPPRGYWFYQEQGQRYWLNITAKSVDPRQPYRWTWQEHSRLVTPILCPASEWNEPSAAPFWQHIFWPVADTYSDLAFRVTSQGEPPQEVNKVVADDFISDGRPIEAVRWWGSYLDEMYQPELAAPPHIVDGWFLSFHHTRDNTTCPPDALAGDAPSVLGVYFAPAEKVEIVPLGYPDCLGHEVYEYKVSLIDCCLLCSEPDPRSTVGPPYPAQPEAFFESADFAYWLDVQAVVGVTWDAGGGCTYEDRVLTGNLPSANNPDGHFWGWHTSPDALLEEACTGRITDVAPYPPNCWNYGGWDKQPWLCPVGPAVPPVNMSFELITTGAQEYIKWSQPPEPYLPEDAINGWDEYSLYDTQQIVADDWFCDTDEPIADIHWWGSFIGWSEIDPPTMPDAFHFAIWTDIPADPGALDFSHPGLVLWEHYATDFKWEFVGWDWDPRDPSAAPEACFKFHYDLPLDHWFHQEPGRNIYWLSIAAMYHDAYQCNCFPDMNCDGVLNLLDTAAFQLALTDPAAYMSTYPGCDINQADLDCDGDIDNDDLVIFQCILAGNQDCCEPSTRVPHPWGWKTRPRNPDSPAPDDAVRIFEPTAPVPGMTYLAGEPIWWPTQTDSWDMAFELSVPGCFLTADPLEYQNWLNWGKPLNWCGPCWRCGDVNGDCAVTFGDVSMTFTLFKNGDTTGYGDTNMDGALTFGDVSRVFTLFKQGSSCTGPCACP